ncbi:zinc finger protein CONSTANS-LIKE 16-like [Oryza brachyantha]|uniref:zinc finger protein CONSTANS-LIKE 16-like n=1 Tax=Oryza brachyantha TaxID=4533 RepID=UPI001ADC6C94|nr:zinc finger protein CONSTANS-LIKE 16-like [Oryza brachyantha]
MTSAAAATGAVLGARTARACDGCMRRRARWHCPADDAFLCQACDASVHSANPLARRHHRVCLPSASSSPGSSPRSAPRAVDDPDAPAWLHGLKRRPRTPRSKPGGGGGGGKHDPSAATMAAAAASAVPDLEAEESGIVGDIDHDIGEDDEDLLYRVPVFDPMLAELYNPVADDGEQQIKKKPARLGPFSEPSPEFASGSVEADGLSGFDVPDMELASFAADMESLLMGVDDGFDDLGFLDEEKPQVKMDLDTDFNSISPAPPERDDRKRKRPEMILKLDYEGVIDSWFRDGASPWFHGERPRFDAGEPWSDFPAGSRGGLGAAVTAVTGGEREARVSRYREKRRTRLFAKKIRYEVRKLNAEKRPRMKGRFVKRAALPPLPLPRQQQQKLPHPHPPPAPPRALPPVTVMLAPRGAHGRFRF